MKKLVILALILFPAFAFAQIPAFPMAFWGNVTINGATAPVGTVIRAYYGGTLAGTITLQEVGVYGYTELTKQKLVVGEGEGTISFKVQSASFNGGAETAGGSAPSYNGFASGSTTQINLAFTIPIPAPPSSGGGGGGGGGGSNTNNVPTSTLSLNAQKVDGNKDNKINILDFNTLMVNWGNTNSDSVADFNEDGKVDILDFNMLMVHWTG